MEGLPAGDVGLGGGGAFVVGVVDVLDYCFAVVEDVGVGDVVHEEEEVVGAGVDVFVDLGEFGWVLADVAGAGGYGAVHADALRVGAEPLAPAVALGGLDAGAEVVAEDVGEGADAEVAGVLLVDVPGVGLEVVDGGDDFGVVAPGEAGPGVDDLLGGEVGVPGEFAEAVEVGHGHGVMHPVGVEADVGYADEAAEGLMEGFAFDDLFDGRALVVGAEVGVERGLPHGDEEDHVALLAEVLLRDLQFDGLAGVLERGEERARRVRGPGSRWGRV